MFSGLIFIGLMFFPALFLLVTSLMLVTQLLVKRKILYLYKLLIMWGVVGALIFSLNFMVWLLGLTYVDKHKIVGHYQIDNSFYPGKNADWQKAHFRFEVKADDTFVLYVRLKDKSERQYIGQINWANENPEKWSVDMLEPHHIMSRKPVLYRSRFDFYYVLNSEKFGNMFFRKVNDGWF